MPELEVEIDGMHCGGCEDRVQTGLSRLDGVRSVEADHEAGTARVTFVAGKRDDPALRRAVGELGYEVAAIDPA